MQAWFYGLALYGPGQWTLMFNDPVCKQCYLRCRNPTSLADRYRNIVSSFPALLNFLNTEAFKIHFALVNDRHRPQSKVWNAVQYFEFYDEIAMQTLAEVSEHKWRTAECDINCVTR
jgi:hypothetical protein